MRRCALEFGISNYSSGTLTVALVPAYSGCGAYPVFQEKLHPEGSYAVRRDLKEGRYEICVERAPRHTLVVKPSKL